MSGSRRELGVFVIIEPKGNRVIPFGVIIFSWSSHGEDSEKETKREAGVTGPLEAGAEQGISNGGHPFDKMVYSTEKHILLFGHFDHTHPLQPRVVIAINFPQNKCLKPDFRAGGFVPYVTVNNSTIA